jgi:uncharacterized membrane protein YgaE (UPF0421/DUF939 family)
VNSETLDHVKHAVKAGLAAALAFYVAQFSGLPESYWAAISAIIVMYSDLTRTLKASTNRLVGTAIGVTIGAGFAALFGYKIWAFGVAITITLLVCGFLGLADAARLAGVGVAIVMIVGHSGRPWLVAIHRFLEVSFGIVIAVLFSAVDWPLRKSVRPSANSEAL